MMESNVKLKNMARGVERMYNAHPFPSRYKIPSGKSDERYKYIYQNFLHIPLDEMKGKLFLDAGCGTGDYTWAWRRILDPTTRVIGLDLSRASVNIGRQAYEANDRPSFGVNSLLNLGVADESVDFLLCSGVLVAV
ncbi:MAG: class I SAM-dependent methyltransferase, partial [Chloroflexi bacterium]|nr:class I SAM-dependent methyltransferase [Chloroflexota bacterium]